MRILASADAQSCERPTVDVDNGPIVLNLAMRDVAY